MGNIKPSLLLGLAIFGGLLHAQLPVKGPLVLFIGPPGSGKSTQAAAASRRLKVPIVSVEELIKSNAATFDKIRQRGISGMEPQSDPVLNRLFEARLNQGDLAGGVILDGYPSTKDHADYLAGLGQKRVLPKPLVIELQIPDDISRKRSENMSADPAAVEQRIKDYHREMDMVRLYFPDAEIVAVDGTRSQKKVESDINSVLKKRFKL